jgi:hypothetical protein
MHLYIYIYNTYASSLKQGLSWEAGSDSTFQQILHLLRDIKFFFNCDVTALILRSFKTDFYSTSQAVYNIEVFRLELRTHFK